MTWSTPRVWSVGEVLTAANLNTYVSNDLAYLYDPPMALLRRSTNYTINNATATAFSFDVVIKDNASLYSGAAPTKLTVPTGLAGVYMVTGCWYRQGNNGSGAVALYVRRNGTTKLTVAQESIVSTSDFALNVAVQTRLAVGDYIELIAFHALGSNLVGASPVDETPNFAASWIGP